MYNNLFCYNILYLSQDTLLTVHSVKIIWSFYLWIDSDTLYFMPYFCYYLRDCHMSGRNMSVVTIQ